MKILCSAISFTLGVFFLMLSSSCHASYFAPPSCPYAPACAGSPCPSESTTTPANVDKGVGGSACNSACYYYNSGNAKVCGTAETYQVNGVTTSCYLTSCSGFQL